MDSILIQALLFNNREYSLFNKELLKTSLTNILQSKFYITFRRINKIIYIDILYCKDNRVDINKDSIINIVKNVFTSITRLYIGIIERPIDN